jgi:anaerobic selenocysteine-containing dehydrogenase
MTEIAGGLVGYRGTLPTTTYNSKGVAFFGSSHLNNDANYLYRKIIANFGTSNVEHQARI